MKETARSLRIYFGICAALQLLSGLSLLATLSLFGLLLGVILVGSGALLGYVAYRLPEMLRTSTRPVIIALGIGVGATVVSSIIYAIMGVGIVGIVFRLLFSVAVSAYLYRTVLRLSAEARGGVPQAPQMAPPPGYGAPQLQPVAPPPYAPPSYGQLPSQQPIYAQPPQQQPQMQQGPYGAPPPMQQQQQPLGPGMQVIVNSPDGRRIPAVILQEQNGQFLCDSQGGQGWVPAHFITRM